jgi:hypothetical protein
VVLFVEGWQSTWQSIAKYFETWRLSLEQNVCVMKTSIEADYFVLCLCSFKPFSNVFCVLLFIVITDLLGLTLMAQLVR